MDVIQDRFQDLPRPQRTDCKLYGCPSSSRLTFKFKKRSQFFIRLHNETLAVVAMSISNEDWLSREFTAETAPTPTGFAEIVSDYFQYFTRGGGADRPRALISIVGTIGRSSTNAVFLNEVKDRTRAD
ncbi:MAG: hypothetical protein DMF21_01875 [Verrucomicrobia bacterium]|nr:MAG: hypothetical protein DME62_07740 [Verrucomicrobiota bacterium]PYL21775.1 MAG: hypothetical protein DMF41_01210 [Verrucomicrobiota bacterium]PYL82609.1 MAG: hypothetical protein DMF21_01875 [Verrucomicrobiota bacterium]